MKKIYTLIFMLSFTVAFAQVEGTWKLSPQAAALGVGPELGNISWWSNSIEDLTIRACYFDDEYIFNTDGTFNNIQGDETWVEEWQGMNPPGCAAPVAPHDGSNAATWTYDDAAGTITLNGVGAYLGLAKVFNGGELTNPADAPASITYPVEFSATGDTMTINISIGGGYWRYIFTTNATPPPPSIDITGVWILAPQAAALGVGPELGDISWWSNSEEDLTTRACYFDDRYVFNEDGSFNNFQEDESWIEAWQGMDPDACGTPVAPHDGSNAATWFFDEAAGTLTLEGVGAYLGLAKVFNGGELTNPADAPASITYPVTFSDNEDTMTVNISIGGGYWRYIFVKGTLPPPPAADLTGTWKIAAQAAALGVGPELGDISWWSNSVEDLTTRDCYFDDKYVFGEDGSFSNVQEDETWIEAWQGMDPDACGTPVAPHDGSNAATWTYDESAASVTLDGVGAYLGLSKVINGGELTDPADAPASITYPLTFSQDGNTITIDINVGGGYWRFILERVDNSSIFETSVSQMSVYPNPATDVLHLDESLQLSQVNVYSVTGQLIISTQSETNVLDVSKLSDGLYTIQGTSKDGDRYFAKFLKR